MVVNRGGVPGSKGGLTHKGVPKRRGGGGTVPRGSVGLVAVSAAGEVTMPYNTTGMFRACATEDGYSEVAIWPA